MLLAVSYIFSKGNTFEVIHYLFIIYLNHMRIINICVDLIVYTFGYWQRGWSYFGYGLIIIKVWLIFKINWWKVHIIVWCRNHVPRRWVRKIRLSLQSCTKMLGTLSNNIKIINYKPVEIEIVVPGTAIIISWIVKIISKHWINKRRLKI